MNPVTIGPATPMTPADRPAEPAPGQYVWYRGWECGFHDDAEFWTGHGWQAYKGGADIGAPNVSGLTFAELLDEIEDDEEGAAIIRTHGKNHPAAHARLTKETPDDPR